MNTTSLKKPRRPPFTSYSELTEALDAATARAEKAETELARLRKKYQEILDVNTTGAERLKFVLTENTRLCTEVERLKEDVTRETTLCDSACIEASRLHAEVATLQEQIGQQLAACDCAATMDTAETHEKNKIVTRDNPFWSPAFESVMHRTSECISLRAEVEALKQSIESGQRVLREDAERNAARAERAEAALAIERQTLSGVIKLKMHFEAESLEQARLLGMSASREASLLGKISRLEHQLEK